MFGWIDGVVGAVFKLFETSLEYGSGRISDWVPSSALGGRGNPESPVPLHILTYEEVDTLLNEMKPIEQAALDVTESLKSFTEEINGGKPQQNRMTETSLMKLKTNVAAEKATLTERSKRMKERMKTFGVTDDWSTATEDYNELYQ